MRIVLCNKYFFLNGGTEKYLHDVTEGLSARGHDPIPFSVQYAGSWASPYERTFLPPPGAPDQAHFKNIHLASTNWLRLLDRSIYSLEARRYLSRLMAEVGSIDVAYLLNIYNYMSPSIIHTFLHHGIPVVMRLGDYHLLCPCYTFLRAGTPCTLCLGGNYLHGLQYRCVKGSFAASALRVLSMYVHKWLGIYRHVGAFVVPCNFMKDKLVAAGFPSNRVHLIKTPIVSPHLPADLPKANIILYFGRISYEKGLDTLIEAYQRTLPPVDLVLIGRSYDGERERLEKLINREATGRIQFLDFMAGEALSPWIAQALFTVVPSRWFDNAPISIYESYLHGTPVLASSIGGIPEQVKEGVTGRLFAPDSSLDLGESIQWMLSDRERLLQMGRAGRDLVLREYSMEEHLGRLLELFRKLVKDAKR